MTDESATVEEAAGDAGRVTRVLLLLAMIGACAGGGWHLYRQRSSGSTGSEAKAKQKRKANAKRRRRGGTNQARAPIDPARARAAVLKAQAGEALSPSEQRVLGVLGELSIKKGRGKVLSERERAMLAPFEAVVGPVEGGREPARDALKVGRVESRGGAVGLTPLPELTEAYQGFDGGLYGGSKNQPPPALRARAREMLRAISPRDRAGRPSEQGKIALVPSGLAITHRELGRLKQLADADPRKRSAVQIVGSADDDSPGSSILASAPTLLERLWDAGLTPAQVQVAWVKSAVIAPERLSTATAHVTQVREHLVRVITALKRQFPNLQVCYLSSLPFGGYGHRGRCPEPFAYETAFAVRGLILEQLGEGLQLTDGAGTRVEPPLLLWGPYLWADGIRPRAGDQLTWERGDFAEDGARPSSAGTDKIARLLLRFLTQDPLAAPWFTATD